MELEKSVRTLRLRGADVLRWVVLTVALELETPHNYPDDSRPVREVENAFEAEEMRGYNWLARQLSRAAGPGREVSVLSFKSVKAPPTLSSVPPTGAAGRIFCYVLRLRDGTEPGHKAPSWLLETLTQPDAAGAGVRFRALTPAGESRLGGRT